jgi:DNA modification methylase
MIFKQDKPWGNGLLSHDCHVAPVPEGNYKGVDMNCHPCQKPLSAMRWLVYALTEPGEMVASPFAGSAPCGVAAAQLGRKYHGIEIDDEYRRIAEGRIAAYGVDRR